MAIGTIATIGSLLLNAYNQNQSSKIDGGQQRLLNKRIDDLDTWYKGESNKDFTQTAEGQAATKRLDSQMKKALDSQGNEAIKTGATPESKVALQGELQEKYGDAISNLSGLTTRKNEGVRRDYTTNMNMLLNQQGLLNQQTEDRKRQSSANLSANIGSALGSLGSTDSEGGFDWLTDLFKGSSTVPAA